ncbi:DUF6993 domain-containing protein [Frigoribacterium faeni]|uniref:DUF6993 domain-containing protein n=1 Tax=Frigoribacterium faeni TaxID=145483 RepID=A0A7W3JIG4_9MICO|nr:hypothetical protein [Frigoribacterium faeni]MBA8813364.1 hypothetical protein [Frigoribacterium faeni]BFF14592.1 hypothetical protein GCM10025699_58950 [Microbacterium flavescens]GEK83120.1 hypothetical protein FFA01_14290 [Frigoribacterium faeni]
MLRSRTAAAAVMLMGLSVGVVACTSTTPTPAPSTSAPAATSTAAPALRDDSPTDEAFTVFDQANRAFLDGGGATDGRSLVDNLVAAGFDKADMQVTSDTTSIGREVDSVQFSVLWGSDCLVGQAGSTGYASQIAPVLGTGLCLIGTTRTIDW